MYPHVTQFEVLKQERERQFQLVAAREALREPKQPRRPRWRRAVARIVPA